MGKANPILVTGAAGFIGFHLAKRLLESGHAVVGIDNLNPYYSSQLKEARLGILKKHASFTFQKLDLKDRPGVERLFQDNSFGLVLHMAAQAGVRYSLKHPHAYLDSNLVGFLNILEGCRHSDVKHLVFASSSSVYGSNTKIPYSIDDPVDHPISLYAATKKANELMAHAYAHLYGIPTTGIRFFTVYGPWGRPDMAYFLFTEAILKGQPISLFNEGKMKRDFTYIDDIVEGVLRLSEKIPPDSGPGRIPYSLYNIGHDEPVDVSTLVALLEEELGRKAEKVFLPMQPGDVTATWADISGLEKAIHFRPKTSLPEGIKNFVAWYRQEYLKIMHQKLDSE
ncbi:MAG: NAD-dependent epimerase [Deltaproteobacteria bacterium]|nr:NAD-dependent epimerase [Deltaproteobacteria bacterium]MBI4373683.1 NAD-dependent epimerase [Deltaproteobacteria bacterium]